MKRKDHDTDVSKKTNEKIAHAFTAVCEAYHNLDDQIDKHELRAYLDKDGMPDVKKIDEDQELPVVKVVLISMYAAINATHDQMHKRIEEVAAKPNVKVVGVHDLPPELLSALADIFNKKSK